MRQKGKTIAKWIGYNLLFTLYIIITGAGFGIAKNINFQTWDTWLGILIAGGGFTLIEHLVRVHTRKKVIREVTYGVKRVAGMNNQVVVFYSKLENDWKIAYENGESELLTEAIDNTKRKLNRDKI